MTGRPPLTRASLSSSTASGSPVQLPVDVSALPERALQFGTGALLRGLVDFFMDEANRQGLEAGRVVVVASTPSGRDARLNAQGGLYTLVSQGIVDGAPVRDMRVVSAVSRAIVAATSWDDVLRVAEQPALELVFSNTTEIGIVFDEADAALGPSAGVPASFPARLARLLLHRARHFGFDAARAPVVVPCELVEHNGATLRGIVLRLADRWAVSDAERSWLAAVPFCDTLVDRIVPGAPTGADADALAASLGYDDAMLTVCEPYRLFAIQGDERIRARLRFADADAGIVVADDIAPYRERKVRLLNGSHTALVHLALLAGCTTVREAVTHPALGAYLRALLFDEIVPSVSVPGAETFAREILDRFANPYIHHALWDITLQGTTKVKVRLVPSIVQFAARTGRPPRLLALGVAGYLAFQRGEMHEARLATGATVPADALAASVRARWTGVTDDTASIGAMVRVLLADSPLWGPELGTVEGFAALVTDALVRIRQDGVLAALGGTDALAASAPGSVR